GNGELPSEEAAGRGTAPTGEARHMGLLLVEPGRAGPSRRPVRDEGGGPMNSDVELREEVRARYAEMATGVTPGAGAAGDCGHPGRTCAEEGHEFGPDLYMALESEQLPEGAILASLGCGNPTAVADLHEGEIVLDLAAGGGIDVLLSAKRVGPTGKVYGLDMTEEMLALAIQN